MDRVLRQIHEKVVGGERLSFDDGLALEASGDLLSIGRMANLVRDFGPRGELFFHSPHNFGASAAFRVPPTSAVVLDNWKLIKLWGENGAPDALYLTNLDENLMEPIRIDPNSSLNRARDFPEVAADLDAALTQQFGGVGRHPGNIVVDLE